MNTSTKKVFNMAAFNSTDGLPVSEITSSTELIHPPNMHVLHVEFLSETMSKPKRVKITSVRFNQWVTLSAYAGPYSYLQDIATYWLTAQGFNLLGMGEGKTGFYFFTDTFKPLK